MRAGAVDGVGPAWAPDGQHLAFVTVVYAIELRKPSDPMLVQGVAGLAAKAVNQGRGDEMVWMSNGNPDMEDWRGRLLARNPRIEDRGALRPWALVDRFVGSGVVKGYILYRFDTSAGAPFTSRPGMDCSANVATSLAGLLGGIMVDETEEERAKTRGLALLADARGRTQAWCFDTYRDRFNRHMVCAMDPRIYCARDLAITHDTFTMYGDETLAAAVMEWLEPLSPVLGWDAGDEFRVTQAATVWGQTQTATNWCSNLPVLMAGSDKAAVPQFRGFDPRTIDWADTRSAVSFVLTDGDNVQWFEGNFFRPLGRDNANCYWDNPRRGVMPFGWSCCFAQVRQLFPQAMEYAAATQLPNDCFIEWSPGGYYYPDLFASKRPDRWELLARYARRVWVLTKDHARLVGFNLARLDSPEALRAYEVFIGQTDGLLGLLAFQYCPYEAGAGQTFWFRDRDGLEVPVITARYSIWENSNNRPRCGTPAKIAREIRETVAATPTPDLPRHDWVMVHAWSCFRRAPGPDEAAENLPPPPAGAAANAQNGAAPAPEARGRGYTPAGWCAERLPDSIRVVHPEELAWRVRMKHNPEQALKQIRELAPWSRE